MDSYQGDLTDILRAGGGPIEGEGKTSGESPVRNWHFQSVPDEDYPKSNCNDFGDPFCHVKDPLVDELNVTKSTFFDNSTDITKPSFVFSPKVRPGNVFSKMLQISPNAKFPIIGDVINSPSSSNTCSVESSLGLQISSPQNTGIKRRKSQAKKVVCIPATSPVNSRAGGEVVPSDLWAWRKYGQKPIKGSPYPRGYYRCSSSKGCSARKQVERSRTEPNMLVITYTSEHNHPWPTQRNALAGSTRSQPSKATSSPKAEKEPLLATNQNMKEEPNIDDRGGTSTSFGQFLVPLPEEPNTIDTNFSISSPKVTSNNPCVKEERDDFDKKNSPMDVNDDNTTYRPLLPPDMTSSIHSDDFFAELGEIGDDDPLNMLFSTIPAFRADHHEERDNNKALDEFPSFFDWIGISNTNNDPAFEDIKR